MKTTKDTNYYITHLVKTNLPKRGYRKLFFCTTTPELNAKRLYLFGTGRKTYDESTINRKINSGELIELPNSIELKKGFGLWVDSNGYVYYGPLENPYNNNTKEIFRPQELAKSTQLFRSNFKHLKKTRVRKFVKLNP